MDEDSLTLAVEAAGDCIAHSDHQAEDLDLIVSSSISRYRAGLSYQFEPTLSLEIRDAIGARRAMTFDVANACAGMMTGVMILDSFIRGGPYDAAWS